MEYVITGDGRYTGTVNVSDILNFEDGIQKSEVTQQINHDLSETNETVQELLQTSQELQEQMQETSEDLSRQLAEAKEALEEQMEILNGKVEEIQGLTELGETVNQIIGVLKNVIATEDDEKEEGEEA